MYLVEVNIGEGKKYETRSDAWERYKKLISQFILTESEESRESADLLRKATKEEVKDHQLILKHLSATKEIRSAESKSNPPKLTVSQVPPPKNSVSYLPLSPSPVSQPAAVQAFLPTPPE